MASSSTMIVAVASALCVHTILAYPTAFDKILNPSQAMINTWYLSKIIRFIMITALSLMVVMGRYDLNWHVSINEVKFQSYSWLGNFQGSTAPVKVVGNKLFDCIAICQTLYMKNILGVFLSRYKSFESRVQFNSRGVFR
ncbi:hypothetical protein QTP88_016774 [Uroleucon formosanum]